MPFGLWVTVVFGSVCTLHAAWLFIRFVRTSSPGAKAVRWMLFGEAIAMATFTRFAYLELTGEITLLSPAVATAMRWVAMLITFGSTVHLRVMISRIDREAEC